MLSTMLKISFMSVSFMESFLRLPDSPYRLFRRMNDTEALFI